MPGLSDGAKNSRSGPSSGMHLPLRLLVDSGDIRMLWFQHQTNGKCLFEDCSV